MQISDSALLKTQAYINGTWIDSDDGSTFTVTNPATCEAIAEVASCGADETRRAIEAAEAAMVDWRRQSAKARAAVLRKWFDLMMDAQEDLAQILTAEQGKPLAEARGEIAYGASYIEWFAEEAKRIYGDTIPPPGEDKRIVVIKQPVGVVACITPWNFPNAMLTRKIAPGAGRRVHGRLQARQRDAAVGIRLCRAGRAGRRACRGHQYRRRPHVGNRQ